MTILVHIMPDAHHVSLHAGGEPPVVLPDALTGTVMRPNAVAFAGTKYWSGCAALLSHTAGLSGPPVTLRPNQLVTARGRVAATLGDLRLSSVGLLALLLRKAVADVAERGVDAGHIVVALDWSMPEVERNRFGRALGQITECTVRVETIGVLLERSMLHRYRSSSSSGAFAAILTPDAVFIDRHDREHSTLQCVAQPGPLAALRTFLFELSDTRKIDPWKTECLWSAFLAWLGRVHDPGTEPFDPRLVDLRFRRCAISPALVTARLEQAMNAIMPQVMPVAAGISRSTPVYLSAPEAVLPLWTRLFTPVFRHAGLRPSTESLERLMAGGAETMGSNTSAERTDVEYGLLGRSGSGDARGFITLIGRGTPLPAQDTFSVSATAADQADFRFDVAERGADGAVHPLREVTFRSFRPLGQDEAISVRFEVTGGGYTCFSAMFESRALPLVESRVRLEGTDWCSGPEMLMDLVPANA